MGSADFFAPLRCAFLARTYPPHAAVPMKMIMNTKIRVLGVGDNNSFSLILIFYLPMEIKSIHIISAVIYNP